MKKINIKFVLKKLIRVYQLVVSPYLGNNCRFYPTCSNYALEALKEFSTFYAIKIIVFRLLRCNPWGGSGIDLLPKRNAKNKNQLWNKKI